MAITIGLAEAKVAADGQKTVFAHGTAHVQLAVRADGEVNTGIFHITAGVAT